MGEVSGHRSYAWAYILQQRVGVIRRIGANSSRSPGAMLKAVKLKMHRLRLSTAFETDMTPHEVIQI
jgi:hypothetical protein